VGPRRREALFPYLLVAPSLAALLGVGLYPFLYMAALSFRRLNFRRLGTAGPFVGLENYANLFAEPVFWESLRTTLLIVLVAVPLELLLGFAAATLFVREFPGKRLAVTAAVIPTILAPVAVAVMWKILLASPWGFLMDTVFYPLGLFRDVSVFGVGAWALAAIIAIDVWQWAPFAFLVFLAGLSSLPAKPYEAAAVDGASPLQTFRHLTLPLLTPFIVVMAFIRLIDAFKLFDTVFILTKGGPGTATETLSLFAYRYNFEYWKLGETSALAIVIFLGFFLVFGFLFRQVQRRLGIFS
jgi:multiple sugar transport system permease protein